MTVPARLLELPERLHVAARRYCMDRHDAWATTYAEMQRKGAGYDFATRTYSDRARGVFPRYLQLHAMRVEIERFEPEAFASLDAARAALIAACERARIPNPAVYDDPLAVPAVDEERELCIAYLTEVDDDTLWRVHPLPYRRVLAPEELAALTTRFKATFGTWYGGLARDPRRKLAFRTYDVPLDPAPPKVLRPLLPRRVFEWSELDESVEQDVVAITFDHTESFWFAADMTWMVYASHEATLTIAGDALVRDVERLATAWWDRRAGPIRTTRR